MTKSTDRSSTRPTTPTWTTQTGDRIRILRIIITTPNRHRRRRLRARLDRPTTDTAAKVEAVTTPIPILTRHPSTTPPRLSGRHLRPHRSRLDHTSLLQTCLAGPARCTGVLDRARPPLPDRGGQSRRRVGAQIILGAAAAVRRHPLSSGWGAKPTSHRLALRAKKPTLLATS